RMAMLSLAHRPRMETIFHIMDVTDDEYLAKAGAALDRQRDTLLQMQQTLGFASLIVAIPDRNQLNGELRRMNAAKYGRDENTFAPLRPNQLLRRSLTGIGISFFDATECVGKAIDPLALYYTIDDHFTAAGHKRFAGCISAALKE